jgi:hypothetical protein
MVPYGGMVWYHTTKEKVYLPEEEWELLRAFLYGTPIALYQGHLLFYDRLEYIKTIDTGIWTIFK